MFWTEHQGYNFKLQTVGGQTMPTHQTIELIGKICVNQEAFLLAEGSVLTCDRIMLYLPLISLMIDSSEDV